MDQRAPYRCSRHKKMDHDYPECVAEARAAAPVTKLEPVVAPRTEPKAKPKASTSRWAGYGRLGGQVGGIKALRWLKVKQVGYREGQRGWKARSSPARPA